MEYEKMRIREFLAEHWAEFESFCKTNGDDADQIELAVADDE